MPEGNRLLFPRIIIILVYVIIHFIREKSWRVLKLLSQ